MTVTDWLTIAGICILGAMTPGPSLAIVLKHTLNSGRSHGIAAGISHGIGVGLYAFACISGLAFVLLASETAFLILQWAGAAYLIWIGIKSLIQRSSHQPLVSPSSTRAAVGDGFMIVFLNPKIALFFIALFSQVVGPDTPWLAKIVYASTAMIIDAAWYVLVAWLFSNPLWLKQLQAKAIWFDRLFGLILIALAGRLVVTLV